MKIADNVTIDHGTRKVSVSVSSKDAIYVIMKIGGADHEFFLDAYEANRLGDVLKAACKIISSVKDA
jgi:hypothetical protein